MIVQNRGQSKIASGGGIRMPYRTAGPGKPPIIGVKVELNNMNNVVDAVD